MNRRSALVRTVVVLGIAAAVAWAGWQFVSPRVVTAINPVRGPAVQAVYATGTVEAGITVRIAPQTAGRIIELLADEGKQVKAGDILARFDDRDLRAAAAELEARAKYAEQQYERIEELSKRGWVTRDKVDQARSESDAARHATRRITEQMTFLTLTAPADGQIIRRDGEVGDFIPVNQPVFYMAKAGAAPRITADVDEEDVPLVKIGQNVLIRADAFPDHVFDGTVAEITPKGDPVARSYRVRIALPETTQLRIGMTAETNIVTRENPNALLVPSSALPSGVEAGGQGRSATASVWLVRDGRAQKQVVRIGIRGRERIEITAGLTETDEVIVTPQGLEAGIRVNAKREAPQKAAPAPASTPAPPPAAAAASPEPKTGASQ